MLKNCALVESKKHKPNSTLAIILYNVNESIITKLGIFYEFVLACNIMTYTMKIIFMSQKSNTVLATMYNLK